MVFLANKNVDFKRWEFLVGSSKYASPFQSPYFYELINSIQNYTAHVFAVEDNNTIIALMVVVIYKNSGLKSYFTRRGIVYGGPLIIDDNTKALQHLLYETSQAMKGQTIYVETRNFFDYSKFKSIFLQNGWEYLPYLDYQISTSQQAVNDVLAGMKYNRRREIKLSLKQDLYYGSTKSESEAKEIYEILRTLYEKRVKLPLPEFSFFIAFLNSPISKVFVVKYKERVIAGSFCLYISEKVLYTMYYCGIREIENKIFPTSIAIYAAIKFAIDNNIQVVDLMGAGQPGTKYGVRDYKAQFGGKLVEYGRFLKVQDPVLYKIGKTSLKLIAKLKS